MERMKNVAVRPRKRRSIVAMVRGWSLSETRVAYHRGM
jgi:hypothetical protein